MQNKRLEAVIALCTLGADLSIQDNGEVSDLLQLVCLYCIAFLTVIAGAKTSISNSS